MRTDDPEDSVWADGLTFDRDTVVAIEAKYVENSRKSMYEGRASPAMLDLLLSDFDLEMERYGAVIRYSGNPVARLRLVTNTTAAADFLLARAKAIVGDDVDLEIQVREEG